MCVCVCALTVQKEEVNLRADMRKESQKRRIRERHARKGGLTASYLEPDRELDLEEDLGAIKSSMRGRGYKGDAGYESDEVSSDEERHRLLQAKRDNDEGTRRGVTCNFILLYNYNGTCLRRTSLELCLL